MKRYAVMAFILVILLTSALLLSAYPASSPALPAEPGAPVAGDADDAPDTEAPSGKKLKLAFSETGHFYHDTINVEIFANDPAAKIYYTTDGSEPTSASKEYKSPLRFIPLTQGNVVTLKAIAVQGDIVTRPLTHTYFLDKNIGSRFDTLVFSLSTNPEYLYDYDEGIFVAGRQRDDYIRENPRANIQPPDPANFNWRGREGERPVYVEVFEPDGTRVVAQAAGIRVSGGWSRANDQKSLRLIARKEYEPKAGKFHYDFFPGDTAQGMYGANISAYDTVVLRNGANDREFGMLRHEAASVLAREAGFREVSPARAAAVFLNGEYYGFAWLQVQFNEQYLQDVYGAPDRAFEIVGDGERWYNSDNTAAVASLKEMYAYADKDLCDDDVFSGLEAIVDISNLLRYYAYEMYMANEDWPQNNMKRWRYTGPWTDGMAPELDGRWRYIMYDLDWVLGLYGDNYTKPNFRDVLEGNNKRSPLLAAILKRPDMAELFTMLLCDIAANIVNRQTVGAVIGDLYGEAAREIARAFAARKYSGWVSIGWVLENHENMKNFAEKRSIYVFGFLERYFGYAGSMFDVEILDGEAIIGTQRGTLSRYYTHMKIPVSPVVPKYEAFDHWVLNGKEIYEPDVTVSYADMRDGSVVLALVTKPAPPPLAFAEGYASAQRNGCTLVNLTGGAVHTAGLYLSNSDGHLLLWSLPAATVEPGGTLSLAGKGSRDAGDLLSIQMGFSVREGDVLFLSDEDGNVLDYITVTFG